MIHRDEKHTTTRPPYRGSWIVATVSESDPPATNRIDPFSPESEREVSARVLGDRIHGL